ncbi:glycine--tRNA ligase, partial [Staphylococcus aureus]|nr:glycine--tRNA ligase [Staphylococcus aureus]
HLNNFNDPMIDNKDIKIRYRAYKLIEDYIQDVKGDENFIADGLSFEQMKKIIYDEGIVCPVSKTAIWNEIRQFNLMFKTFQGV